MIRPISLILAISTCVTCADQLWASEADALLRASGNRGGLCLLVSANDLSLAQDLADKGYLYIQQLTPDTATALSLAGKVSASDFRERVGIRNTRFDPSDYATDLFNLIVMTTPIPEGVSIDEIARILAPGGVLAVESAPTDLDGKAGPAKLEKKESAGAWSFFSRPVTDPAIKPTDGLRWRAGSRWQRITYHDFASVTFGNGTLLYRETVAARGGGFRFELVCRDAYNGRMLWKIEEPPFTKEAWASYLRYRMGLAVSGNGKIYTGLGKDFVCLDERTGAVLLKLAENGRPKGSLHLHKDRILAASGDFIDVENGEKLGSYAPGRTVIVNDCLYSLSGRTVAAHRIPDGKLLWKADVKEGQPGGQISRLLASERAIHVVRIWPASISAMDLETGELLWTYPPAPPKANLTFWAVGDKIYAPYKDESIKEPHDFVLRCLDAATGKVVREKLYSEGKKWAGGCWSPRPVGDYFVYHHNIWFNLSTGKRTAHLLFRPKCDQGPLPVNGLLYGFPGRKGGAIKGIAALAPRDIEFGDDPGGRVLKKLGTAPEGTAVAKSDWPMFRGNPARGNSVVVSLGEELALKWETAVGLGGKTYGRMDSERTGLAQPTCAWGTAFAADIDGGRVVALDAESGQIKWTFHVGARVAFSPTLHDGLCLFGAKNGWVHCLDANTGKPIYKLLAAPRERYIGGQEKLESMWPVCGDVLVANGVAYASAGVAASIHGGIRVVAFQPRTGKVLWSKCIQGVPARNDIEAQPGLFVLDEEHDLVQMGRMAFDPKTGEKYDAHKVKGILRGTLMEDWLSTNNLHRLGEDMGGVGLSNGSIHGRLVAFNKDFEMGFSVARKGKTVFHIGAITLAGRSTDGNITWAQPTKGLNIDDLLLTSNAAYCVGHFEESDKSAELRIISLPDGKTLATHEINGFPSYNGVCATGNKLLIATREGKMICFEALQP